MKLKPDCLPCERCGAPVFQGRRGRIRKYCDACRPLAVADRRASRNKARRMSRQKKKRAAEVVARGCIAVESEVVVQAIPGGHRITRGRCPVGATSTDSRIFHPVVPV